MNQSKLSADPVALVLAIISIVIGVAGCCCYGILAIIPLILAIIGLVMANKSIREYNANPEAYSPQSRSNVGTAKVINIIAIIFNGVIVLFFIIFFVLYGTLVTTAILDDIQNGNDSSYNDYEFEEENDYKWEEDDYIIEEEVDSVEIDTTAPKSVNDVINNLENNGVY